MKNLFVPYEIVVIAKEKGFDFNDEETLGFYSKKYGVTIHSQLTKEDGYKPAATYQQIFDWFLTKNISIERHVNKRVFTWKVVDMDNNKSIITGESLNPFQCRNEAILEAFKLL